MRQKKLMVITSKIEIIPDISSSKVKEHVYEKELGCIFVNNNVNISASDFIDLN